MVEYLATPRSAPPLNIPPSQATVTVRVIDSTATLHIFPKDELFWKPHRSGFDLYKAPVYCFLISHGDRHTLFDLSVRRDWESLAPRTVSLIKATTVVEVEKNISEILDSDMSGLGVRSTDIEAIIWSHGHFDHTGDPSTFPPSTELIVGAGTMSAMFPGHPTNPDALVLDSDVRGRTVREIDVKRDGAGLKIGRFDAYDYFGDGSFYLLDAPGHAVGHLCGLARVTNSDGGSFIFMGADACHHPGALRPTEYLPLPTAISPSPLQQLRGCGAACPGSLILEGLGRGPESDGGKGKTGGAIEPFFTLSEKLFPAYEDALDTVKKIEELDADDRVFVILAHDASLKEEIDFFPKTIDDWKLKRLRSKTRWLFCRDFEACV